MKYLKRVLALVLVAVSMFAVAIPTEVAASAVGQTGTVSCNNAGLKIRKTASTKESTYWLVGNGTKVKITSVPDSTWYGVEVTTYVKGSNGTGYKGLKGFAQQSFITGVTNSPNPTTPPGGGGSGTPSGTSFNAVISGTSVNVRKDSPSGGSLGTVSESDGSFTCYRPATPVQSGGHFWVQIKDNSSNKFSGDYGWIAATYVMAGTSISSNRTACSVCGKSVTLNKTTRSFYKNTGNGYHNCTGSGQLLCSINMGREIKEYKCSGNSSHPIAKTVIFTDGIRGCQLPAWTR